MTLIQRPPLNTASLKHIAALGLLLLSQWSAAQTAIPDYIQKAVSSTARPTAMSERDPARRPAEVLAMSGIKPGDIVVEIAGVGQYYTTILSDVVGANGKIHMYDLPYTEERAGAASRAFIAAHPNTTYTIVNYNEIKLPANVDIVFNMLYYHDLSLNAIDVAAMNKKIFAALKPGGVYMIEDHNAAPNSGTRDTKALHRIDPEVIKKEVLAAGFTLAEESKLLANAGDDHTKMVFTPGTRGATDRTLLKFVKP
jgi:predicted methyltransferase